MSSDLLIVACCGAAKLPPLNGVFGRLPAEDAIVDLLFSVDASVDFHIHVLLVNAAETGLKAWATW
ncbi:MAG: hypothetical protein ACXVJ0_13950 [Candidatus Angelobacter sp.]